MSKPRERAEHIHAWTSGGVCKRCRLGFIEYIGELEAANTGQIERICALEAELGKRDEYEADLFENGRTIEARAEKAEAKVERLRDALARRRKDLAEAGR